MISAKKNYIQNTATCTCENVKYLGSIIHGSVITCEEIIEATKIVPTKSISTNFYILLIFLLITIALLIAVSIYCYLIIYRSKNNDLLPYREINNKLKEIDINDII